MYLNYKYKKRMGIKNLHRVLEKYAPGCYTKRHLSHYSYKKIAIDISLYLYKYKAIHGERWVECFLALIVALRKWDVHCIFIYDGKAPQDKVEEQLRRREVRSKMGDKIALLEQEIREYEQNGTVGPLIEEIQKKEGVVSLFRKKTPINISLAKAKVESMKGMMISITPDDITLSQKLFDAMQVPYLKAPAEAECYASHLCVSGLIDGVLSEDTDVLAYGTPIFLTKIDVRDDTLVEINYSKILEETGMTLKTFTDLCIMCSCDYNTNIPLIGFEKSYQLLKTHVTIENVISFLKTSNPKKYNDEVCSVVRYERCRELFTTSPVDCVIPYCGIPNFELLQDFLFIHNIQFDIKLLRKYLRHQEIVLIDDEKKE